MKDALILKVNGLHVEMSNRYLRACFNEQGKAYSLIYNNQELIGNLEGAEGDPDKHNCFYCDYHVKGGTVSMKPTKLKIIENNSQLIHVSYIDDLSNLGIEYHLILRSNDSAIYSYVKAWNNSGAMYEINEFRTVYRLDHRLLYIGYNGERQGMQPTSAHMLQGKKLQDETYDMQDGSLYSNSSIYSKYDYAGFFRKTNLWGQYGKNYGFWFIPVNTSYYGSGPETQDLMVHYDGIVLNYMSSEHFGRGTFKIPAKWEKLYGPWCIYVNNGNIADAEYRANEESNNWPYNWVHDKLYPLELGSISGNIESAYSSKKYRVVLADKPAKGDIINQHEGYTYYTDTDPSGNFAIEKVRPGTYTIYAYGIDSEDLETHILGEVQIREKHDSYVGKLYIKREYRTLWQIGSSSHSTDGMKFSDQLRNYAWLKLIPRNLYYHVGRDDDWYYLQKDDGAWNIHFKTDQTYTGAIHLQLGLAGVTQKVMTDTSGTNISIKLNDQLLAFKRFENDRAAYRSSMKGGKYHLWDIEVPSNLFKQLADNVITITTNGYVMYDTIKMCAKEEA